MVNTYQNKETKTGFKIQENVLVVRQKIKLSMENKLHPL